MQIKELGDESFNAPLELRDIEKSSLLSSGDESFSNFNKSFDKLYSLITAYIFKRNSNTIGSDKQVDGLLEKIYTINSKKADEIIDKSDDDNKDAFNNIDGLLSEKLNLIEKPDPINVQTIIDGHISEHYDEKAPVLYLIGIGHTLKTVNGFVQSLTKSKDTAKIKKFDQLIIIFQDLVKTTYSNYV